MATATLIVRNDDGGEARLEGALTYQYPAPTIDSVTPSVLDPTGGTVVTILGSGFRFGAVVEIGTQRAGITELTATRIVCLAPPEA